jgi:serine/threonine protein kinase
MQDLIGKTIGQYQIIEQIGKGGMATIFKAFQPAIDRYVAVKVLPRELARDPNFVKRFVHEAKAIAALEHPHILPVHDFGTADDINYMVMRYVKGGTLADVMGTPVPLDKVVKYVANVARALDYAHRSGVVHRDIKPSNVLIDEHGEVLLTDFGIAKIVEDSKSTQLTAAGSILGTPAYMSPEQAQGSGIDGRSDIYSLGVVLYELLTGEPPYQGETPYAVVLKHVSDPLPPPRQKNPDIPEIFERIVFKTMAKSPEDRFKTADDLARALEDALIVTQTAQYGGKTVAMPGPAQTKTDSADESSEPPQKKPRRQLWIAGGMALALACITLCGALLLLRAGSNKNNTANQTETSIPSASGSGVIGDVSSETSDNSELPTAETKPGTDSGLETDMGTVVPPPEPDAEDEVDVDGLLFADSFSDNRNNWLIDSYEDEFGYYSTSMEDGLFVMFVTSESDLGNTVWVEPTTEDFSDFVLSVKLSPDTENQDFLYGVVFRSTETDEGDTDNAYMFELDNAGFVVSLVTADDWIDLVEYTESSAIRPNSPNELTVEAIGPSMVFFINGEEVAAIIDDNIETGQIGLIAEIFEEAGELLVEVDRFYVIEPQ